MKLAVTVLVGVLLLCGCTAPEPAEDAGTDTMLHLGETMRPEVLLFPDYLLPAGFEIDQHGRIPESQIIGADMQADLELAEVLKRFTDVLDAHAWKITREETAERSFRLTAILHQDRVEIRAVQGTGPAKVFLLYRPGAIPQP